MSHSQNTISSHTVTDSIQSTYYYIYLSKFAKIHNTNQHFMGCNTFCFFCTENKYKSKIRVVIILQGDDLEISWYSLWLYHFYEYTHMYI